MNLSLPIKVLLIIVLAYFAYSYAIYSQNMHTKSASETISPLAMQGKDVFQKYNCISCHQMYGLGGYLGPDLTNTISEKGEVYAEVFLRNGSNRMPNYNLNEEEIYSLLAFLRALSSSGEFPVKEFDVSWYGTIEEKNKP